MECLDGISLQDWEPVRKRVADRLRSDYYWQVFEPLEVARPEPVSGSLSDDLADVWRDLKVGLQAMDGNALGGGTEAVWHWRFSFESHWVQHAAGAIAALSALCYGQFADPSRP